MRVLLVDDEPAVREAMEMEIDWESYGITNVFYAENGLEALEILETHKPDIMFCDMEMPKMNGMQLLNEIKIREIETKVIAVSGYNDFAYVKSTIQAGGLDYILKPIDPDEVVEVLDKAISLRQKEMEEEVQRKLYEKINEEAKTQLLREWLAGKVKYDTEVESTLRTFSFDGETLGVTLLIIQNFPHVCEDLFEGDSALLKFALGNVIGEILGSEKQKIVDIDEFLQVLLVDGVRGNTHQVKLDKFVSFCKQYYGLSIVYETCGNAVAKENLYEKVEELKQQFLLRSVKIDGGVERQANTRAESMLGLKQLLHSAIGDRNIDGANRLISGFCNELMKRPKLTYRDIQMQTIEANFLLNRFAHERDIEEMPVVDPISIWIFDMEIWQEAVKHRVYQLMEYQKENKLNVESVYRYLQEHYQENITIETLTEFFYQSPQHISRRFKERYNVTIVTALRQIRMEHAKKYLETTSLPILEIAKMTGYEDENYFSKVFKKEIGVSPKSYRQNRV